MNRRDFFKLAGAGAAGLGAFALGGTAEAGPITADKRGYVAGKFALELDGIHAGWLYTASGGFPSSDVVTEKLGTDHIIKKHIAGVKYEPIVIQFGPGMS